MTPKIDKRATPANALKSYTEQKLNAAGWKVFRINAGQSGKKNIHQAPDFTPDIIGRDPWGRYVGLEIKIGRDKLSNGQREELRAINNTRHGKGDVIRCPEDVDRILSVWPTWLPSIEAVDLSDKRTRV